MLHIFAAVLALSDPSGAVVEARIADVIADPERYRDQMLRIRGQVDACYGFVCSICPEQMTPAASDEYQCLRIAFDDFMSEVDENGPTDAPWTPFAQREVETAFRHSVITAEGSFNPACQPHRPSPPGPSVVPGDGDEIIEMVVCTDRASTWRGVQVRKVHRRIPSNYGLIFDRDGDELLPASPDVSDAVLKAYRADVAMYDAEPITAPMVVLIPAERAVRSAEQEARVCISKMDGPVEWPKRDISFWAHTPNDPYVCYVALKNGADWRVFSD